MSDLTLPSQVVPSRWMRIVPILLLHALTLLLVSVVLCSLVPGLQEYYRHANLEIPAATLSIIRLSDRLVVFWTPVFCLIMISDFLLMLVLTSLKPSKRWPLSAYSQIFVFCALVLAAYVAAWSANLINYLVGSPRHTYREFWTSLSSRRRVFLSICLSGSDGTVNAILL